VKSWFADGRKGLLLFGLRVLPESRSDKMASMFESYERELRQLVDSISKRLSRLQGLTGGLMMRSKSFLKQGSDIALQTEQRKDAIRGAEKDFQEADDMVRNWNDFGVFSVDWLRGGRPACVF
jgi:hypothetical protein